MDTLKNKKYATYDYLSRYTGVPYYFDTLAEKEIYGIGTNLKTDTAWVEHKVRQEDTLDSLALKYYNNPTYWWIIAFSNKIQDPFENLYEHFKVLKIPNMTSIEFGNERK